ncbi:MAG: hypothetical protein KKH33_08580 [Alphaproteobacteria bacterium]|nr:hypothetical protein [Alphaproteobacteria bacterium]
MATDQETRRGIAQRALARARDQGVALEDDLDFMVLLDEWISGKIPMRDMSKRHFSAVEQREQERLVLRRSQETMSRDQDGRSAPSEADKKEGPSVNTAAREL